jgi:uncharacterized membrane protein
MEIIPNWHPIFVHFTVALLSLSVVLFLVSKVATDWRLEDQWLATGYWNLWLGTLLSIGTVAAGWVAFNTVNHDTEAHKVMLEHRNLAFATLGAFVVLSIWAIIQYRSQKRPSIVFVIAALLGLGLVGVTAWHGAELVYRHGLGVMALPKKEDHSHVQGQEHGHEAAAASHESAEMSAGGHEHAEAAAQEAPADAHHHEEAPAQEEPTEPAAAGESAASEGAASEGAASGADAAAPAAEQAPAEASAP